MASLTEVLLIALVLGCYAIVGTVVVLGVLLAYISFREWLTKRSYEARFDAMRQRDHYAQCDARARQLDDALRPLGEPLDDWPVLANEPERRWAA